MSQLQFDADTARRIEALYRSTMLCVAASWFARHSGQSSVTESSTLDAGLASTVSSSRRSLVRPAP